MIERVKMPTFITLGPSGTCHENALRHYLDFQGSQHARIVLVDDLLEEGLEQLRGKTKRSLYSAALTCKCTSSQSAITRMCS